MRLRLHGSPSHKQKKTRSIKYACLKRISTGADAAPLVLDVATAADGILLHNGANVVKAMRLMREEASDGG